VGDVEVAVPVEGHRRVVADVARGVERLEGGVTEVTTAKPTSATRSS
jgi:hypothetical protein